MRDDTRRPVTRLLRGATSGRRRSAAGRAALAPALLLPTLLLVAAPPARAAAEETPGAAAPSRERREILIGPSIVTLAEGGTIDAVAVIRDLETVTVMLEDGTRLVFEADRIASVISLAELDAPPARPPRTSRPARRRPATPDAAGRGVPGAPAAAPQAPTPGADPAAGDAAGAAAPDIEGAREPSPEDFDATLPVALSGFRYIGAGAPALEIPAPDFPRAGPPPVSLAASRWRPAEGFPSESRWPPRIEVTSTIRSGLSGYGAPVTSLGPRFHALPPSSFLPPIRPFTWRPADGFEKGPLAPGRRAP